MVPSVDAFAAQCDFITATDLIALAMPRFSSSKTSSGRTIPVTIFA